MQATLKELQICIWEQNVDRHQWTPARLSIPLKRPLLRGIYSKLVEARVLPRFIKRYLDSFIQSGLLRGLEVRREGGGGGGGLNTRSSHLSFIASVLTREKGATSGRDGVSPKRETANLLAFVHKHT